MAQEAPQSTLKTIKFFARRAYRRLREELGAPLPAAPVLADDAARLQYAKNVFANGALPTNFTFTLGVAPCNYSCRFCPQSVSKPKKAVWLDLDLMRKCLTEMPEENIGLNISSYSETIAAPNLVDAVRLMKEVRPKLKVIMATNGSLYREKVIEALIDSGLDHYSYSFDAASREAYKDLIQLDYFDRAWKNLEQIVELRNRKKSPMKITTHIMHFQGVEKDFEKFKAHWEGKIDAVLLRPLGNWGGSESLALMQKLAEMGYVPAHRADGPRYPCNSAFMHFQLQPDGHYMPCIGTTPEYESNLEYSLGHASETTWSEAWARLTRMRMAHLRGEWDKVPACRNCNIWSLWHNAWQERQDSSGERFQIPGVTHAR